MMGEFTEGEVAIANWEIWTLFSEGNVVMFNSLLLEFFQEALPLGEEISCSRDGRWSLSRGCSHRGMIPESNGLVNRC